MIQKFRKKSIVIEAIQFTGNNEIEIMHFVGKRLEVFRPPTAYEHLHNITDEMVNLTIPTSEGDMVCNRYDWVVKEPFDKKRGFYPVKNTVFKLTYENADRKNTEITKEQYNDALEIIHCYEHQGIKKEEIGRPKHKIPANTNINKIKISKRLEHSLCKWTDDYPLGHNLKVKDLSKISITDFLKINYVGKVTILELQNLCKKAGVKLKP